MLEDKEIIELFEVSDKKFLNAALKSVEIANDTDAFQVGYLFMLKAIFYILLLIFKKMNGDKWPT